MRRVLVIRSGGIGDFILTLPVLRALRLRWPEAHLEILGHPRIAVLAQRGGAADQVRSIDEAVFARLFTSPDPGLDDVLSRYLSSFDLVVSFLRDREGMFQYRLDELKVSHLFVSAPSGARHAAEDFLSQLVELGIQGGDPTPHLTPSASDREEAERILRDTLGDESGAPAAIHPGSGSTRKNWPAEKFAEVIRWLAVRHVRPLLVGGEADQKVIAEVTRMTPRAMPLLKDLPLPQLAAILERSALFLGNDSGISHLAAAVGTPILALFSSTSPTVWRPLGPNVRILQSPEASVVKVEETITAMLSD